MAFGKGKVQTGESVIKRYVGVAPVKVLGVNLSKEELSEKYGREITKDQEYLGEVDSNGVKVQRVRISFLVQCELEGKEFMTTVNYNIQNSRHIGQNTGKIEVIDEYGRTAWATQEELDNKTVPMYSNGPANISSNYRPVYNGEAKLTLFLQRLLGIPNVTKFVDNKPCGLIDNPADAECRLEHIADYFKNDFSELKEILSYQPENKVKLLFGVRKDDKNNIWQDCFTDFPMGPNVRNYTKLLAELEAAKNANRYPETIFLVDGAVCDVTEYEETPTSFSSTGTQAQPAQGGANPWFKK